MNSQVPSSTRGPSRSARARRLCLGDPAVWAWLAVAVMLVVPALSVLA